MIGRNMKSSETWIGLVSDFYETWSSHNSILSIIGLSKLRSRWGSRNSCKAEFNRLPNKKFSVR